MAPPAQENASLPPLETRVNLARQQARRVLWVESAWTAIQWPLALVGGYALSGLMRLPQSLPDTLHAFLLAGVGGGALALGARNLSRIRPPRLQAIDRRIEQKSGLRHRPLSALDDLPADGDESAFWLAHMDRLRQSVGRLRTGWPHLRWSTARALGWAGFAACFALTLVIAGTRAPSRLEAAFLPGVDDSDVALPQIEAWIDLPDYAPGAPIFLSQGAAPPPVAQGARLTIHVTGARSGPHLLGVETSETTVHQLDSGSWSFAAPLLHSGRVSIRSRGRTVGEWQFEIVPDLPPEIAWQAPPHKAEDDATLDLPYRAAQAHGIARINAEITLLSRPDLPALVLPVPLKGMPLKTESVFETDLTESLWAGDAVSIRLHATSRGGKEATSKAETVTLPARSFRNPTARAIISLRHRFGMNRETAAQTAEELRALAETLPLDEKGSMLALIYAAAQLENPDDERARGNTLGLCWAVALYLEDRDQNGRETAQANLEIRAAQKAVQDQISRMRALGEAGHTEEQQQELARRIARLKDALNERMQALMQRSLQLGTIIPDVDGSSEDGSDPVSRLMRRLQSDAASGQSDDALKRLEELSRMAGRMRDATPQDLAKIAEQMQARARAQAQRATLRDLVQRETTLLDHVQARLGLGQRAIREAEQAQSGGNGPGQDLSTMPTAELLRRLGMSPPPDMDTAPPATSTDDTTPPPLSPEQVTAQHEQRREDHAVQRALQMVAQLLNEDIKALTGKTLDGLVKADHDMKPARSALASAQDKHAEAAIRQVLKDLAQAGQQMTEAQKGKNHGGGPIALLPTMGTGQHAQGGGKKSGNSDNDGADDSGSPGEDKADRDPLGRKTGKGHSGADTEGTVPDADSREKAREIERELRRRDADRTRPQSELDYLDRLLKSY